jgi:hypothetical protein
LRQQRGGSRIPEADKPAKTPHSTTQLLARCARIGSHIGTWLERRTPERLKAQRTEGLGFDRIAARMNEEGIATRTGKPWHGVVVNRILTGKR